MEEFRYSGDLVKAYSKQVEVIIESFIACSTEEAPGNMIHLRGRKFKSYRGMGSLEA